MNISNWSFNVLNQKAQHKKILNKASKTMLTSMVSRFLANPNINTSLNSNYCLKKISSYTTIRKWKLASKSWETSVASYSLNKETQTTSLWEKREKERKWCNILLNHEYWFGNKILKTIAQILKLPTKDKNPFVFCNQPKFQE